METHDDEQELSITNTYKFIRDLELPAEPSISMHYRTVKEINPKRAKTSDYTIHEGQGIINRQELTQRHVRQRSPNSDYFYVDSKQSSRKEIKNVSDMDDYISTNICDTLDNSEISTHNSVASAVWNVIDPRGSMRGLCVNVPDETIFTTEMASPTDVASPSYHLMDKDQPVHVNRKGIRRLSKCVLYPPPEDSIISPKNDRPVGCKTVFVSGLPEKMNKDIVREVFEDCGRITSIRMSRGNYCHIQFSSESAVDRALRLCGYRVKIGSKMKPLYFGKLYVDFARLREDKCRIQESQHRKEGRYTLPLLPPEEIPYSEMSVAALVESLREEVTFKDGVLLLIHWMETGMCNTETAVSFVTMIQGLNSFVSKLMNDTAKVEEEVRQHECLLKGKYAANALQFADIEKVFNVASMKKVWDQFTKAQRKRIKIWKKHIQEIMQSNSRDLLSNRVEDSDTEKPNEELNKLHKENERLKNQLLVVQKDKSSENLLSSVELTSECRYVPNTVSITESDARLIALIGAFLNFHRYGESIDCIYEYLLKKVPTITSRDVETLMRKFPTVFKEKFTEIGGRQERKWTFLEP